jgi:hypothetical protein
VLDVREPAGKASTAARPSSCHTGSFLVPFEDILPLFA